MLPHIHFLKWPISSIQWNSEAMPLQHVICHILSLNIMCQGWQAQWQGFQTCLLHFLPAFVSCEFKNKKRQTENGENKEDKHIIALSPMKGDRWWHWLVQRNVTLTLEEFKSILGSPFSVLYLVDHLNGEHVQLSPGTNIGPFVWLVLNSSTELEGAYVQEFITGISYSINPLFS